MKDNIKYLKLFTILLISLLITKVTSGRVFIADTPKIKPQIAYRITHPVTSAKYLFARIFLKNSKSYGQAVAEDRIERAKYTLKDQPYIPLTKSVSAKSNEYGTMIEININKIDYDVYTYTFQGIYKPELKGKKIVVKVPVGSRMPSPQQIEQGY